MKDFPLIAQINLVASPDQAEMENHWDVDLGQVTTSASESLNLSDLAMSPDGCVHSTFCVDIIWHWPDSALVRN